MRAMTDTIRSLAWCLLLVLVAHPAAAVCHLRDITRPFQLTTRKPLWGDEVRLVSGYGMRIHPLLNRRRMHTGVDWGAPRGTPIIAPAAGRVVSARRESQYGNIVVIDHGGGVETAYAHLNAFDVREGDCVVPGARLGSAGMTGLSSSSGTHFEVRRNGNPVDPMQVPIIAD